MRQRLLILCRRHWQEAAAVQHQQPADHPLQPSGGALLGLFKWCMQRVPHHHTRPHAGTGLSFHYKSTFSHAACNHARTRECSQWQLHVLQHWGYYYSALNPAAVVNSGDTIVVETSTQHGGDDYDKIVRGDPGMEVGGLTARGSG